MAPTLERRTEPSQEGRSREGGKAQEGATSGFSSYLIKVGAVGLMLGGLGWIAVYLLSLRLASAPLPDVLPAEFSLWLYMGTILLSVVGLIGLHAVQRGSYGGVGRAGFYTILASSVAIVAGGIGQLFGSMALEWLAYPVGMLGVIVGFSLYGAATAQARVLPRWYGVMLIVFLPLSVLFGTYDNLWVGVVQLILGSVLWRRRLLPTESAPGEHGLRTTVNTHSARLGIQGQEESGPGLMRRSPVPPLCSGSP
jgi:hypothetical protein